MQWVGEPPPPGLQGTDAGLLLLNHPAKYL